MDNNTVDTNEKKGTVQISGEVIAVIAATAAREVEGVVKLMPANTGLIFGKKTATKAKGVELEIVNGEVSVEASIMVLYNTKIHEVAQKVQENIKNAIETMTGLTVKEVNVVVADVDFQKEAESPAE